MNLNGSRRMTIATSVMAALLLMISGTTEAQVIHEDGNATEILGLDTGVGVYDVIFKGALK